VELTCIGILPKFSENFANLLLRASLKCKSSLGFPALWMYDWKRGERTEAEKWHQGFENLNLWKDRKLVWLTARASCNNAQSNLYTSSSGGGLNRWRSWSTNISIDKAKRGNWVFSVPIMSSTCSNGRGAGGLVLWGAWFDSALTTWPVFMPELEVPSCWAGVDGFWEEFVSGLVELLKTVPALL
jgi:hypothetical protein